MSFKAFAKSPVSWLYLGGVLLVIIALVVWCARISLNPERVFWGTISRGLATNGVTIKAEQNGNGINARQTMQYSVGLNTNNTSHAFTKLVQGKTVVENEMVATPTTDYVRYNAVTTDQKKANGQKIDFSKILGVWAQGPANSGQFFAQSVFGSSLPVGGIVVPIGNLPASQRSEMIKQIRNDDVYQVAFDKTKKQHVDGRLQYVYEVTVRPSAYIAMIKQFAHEAGLRGLEQVDPSAYASQKPFKFLMTIDARSRQVVYVSTTDSTSNQTYSSYDVPVQVGIPKNTITTAKLQQLLSGLQ